MPAATEQVSRYLQHFNAALTRDGGEPSWLRERRERAMERFLTLGIPTTRDEEYKYTDLSALVDGKRRFDAPRASAAPTVPVYARTGSLRIEAGTATPISGASSAVETGVHVLRLDEALRREPELMAQHFSAIAPFEDHALSAANTAFFEDAVVVVADPGVIASQPVHLVFGSGPVARNPRVLIVAGRNSAVQVVETYIGAGTYWRNAVTEIRAEENARVDHYRASIESPDAYHTALLQATQGRDSYVATFSLSFGGAVVRNDIRTRLDGSGCECSLDGLYTAGQGQHVDHHTAIDHAMPHCNSHQLYKGVLDGNAKGVFNGKIFVRRDAQKTDAVQSNKNLLLSDEAEVNTKPQLEIDANDVRCTHGATIGQLDAESAFYLRSRGISAAQARNILTYAFAADALARIRLEPLREHFEALLLSRFAPREG